MVPTDDAAGAAPAATAANPPAPWRVPRLGIAARLALGFVVVALLFLVANRITERSTWLAATAVARVEFEHEPLARVAQSLALATGAYERAVLERADPAAARVVAGDDADSVARARRDLLAALDEHAALVAATSLDAARKLEPATLRERVEAFVAQGAAVVAQGDRRRAELQRYWRQFDALETRVARANGARLALGDHVFVRRSVTELAAALGAVRDRFGAYLASPDARHETAVTEAEIAFRNALVQHAAALTAAHDGAWVSRTQGDFESNVTQRENVIRAERRYARERLRFADLATKLQELVDAGVAAPARAAMADATQRAGEATDGADRALAKVSVATMLLVGLVSVLTVWSVAVPVRRLTAGTRGLAAGRLDTRVPRGGAPEFDGLAASFNTMAAGLESAHEALRRHQAELEARVDERTRQLRHLAHHDPLTALPNRRHLYASLAETLAADAERGARTALLLLDLDNFKVVNDSLGHEFGDLVLQAAAERLRAAIGDAGALSRLGGDEFTVTCAGLDSGAAAEELAARIVSAFREPLVADGRELLVGVSIGAAVAPDDARDAESLLRAADSALFRAKELGRNRASIYSPALYQAAASRFRTEQALRRAVDGGEFDLLYQPQVQLQTLEVDSVEALLRWRGPDGTLHSPVEFLQVAEQSGLIVPIGEWVLAAAAAAARRWDAGEWPGARVAINVSPQQFFDGGFVTRVERTLRDTGLSPGCLEIELTESVVQTGAQTIEALERLRALGVALALDDFGTGYSSMTSLEKLPLSRVKLDRSLVADVDRNDRSAAIARSTIRLCHDLGLRVTAEGVERATQVEWLLGCGPVEVQGWWFAKPLAAAEIPAYRADTASRSAELSRVLLERPARAEVLTLPPHRRRGRK